MTNTVFNFGKQYIRFHVSILYLKLYLLKLSILKSHITIDHLVIMNGLLRIYT